MAAGDTAGALTRELLRSVVPGTQSSWLDDVKAQATTLAARVARAGYNGPEKSFLRVRSTGGTFSALAGGDACALHDKVPVATTGGVRLHGALSDKHYFEAKVELGTGARVGVANGRCVFAGAGNKLQLGEAEGSWALDLDEKKLLIGGQPERAVEFGLEAGETIVNVGVMLDLEKDTLGFLVNGHAVASGAASGAGATDAAGQLVQGKLLAAAVIGGGLRPAVAVKAPYCVGVSLGNGHGDKFSQPAPAGYRAFGLQYRPGLAALVRTAEAVASQAVGAAAGASDGGSLSPAPTVRQSSDDMASPVQQMAGGSDALSKDVARHTISAGAQPLNEAPLYLGAPSIFAGGSALGDLEGVDSSAKDLLKRTSECRPRDAARVFVSGVQLVPRAGLGTEAVRFIARSSHALSPLRGDSLEFDPEDAQRSTGMLLGEKAAMEAICVADSVAKSDLGAQGLAGSFEGEAASSGDDGRFNGLGALLRLFLGGQSRVSLQAGAVLARVMPKIDPSVADAAVLRTVRGGLFGTVRSVEGGELEAQQLVESVGGPGCNPGAVTVRLLLTLAGWPQVQGLTQAAGISQSAANRTSAGSAPVFGALQRAQSSPFVAQGIASRAQALLQVILASRTVDQDESEFEEKKMEMEMSGQEEGGPTDGQPAVLSVDSLGRQLYVPDGWRAAVVEGVAGALQAGAAAVGGVERAFQSGAGPSAP